MTRPDHGPRPSRPRAWVRPPPAPPCPWPGFPREYTSDAARRLLRGKTVVVSGDSTSRRLMWALCRFLSGNVSAAVDGNPDPGAGCCSTKRVWIYCNRPEVTASGDILLAYSPILRFPEYDTYFASAVQNALRLRGQLRLASTLGPDWGNDVPPEQMPPSRVPRAVHMFAPAAATWHAHMGDGGACGAMLPGRWGSWNVTCAGAEKFAGHPDVQRALAAGQPPNATDTAACALTAAFCARFAAAVPLATAASRLPPTAKVYGHGMSNVLAETGSRKGFDRDNRWQLRVASALNPTARAAMCSSAGLQMLSGSSEGLCRGLDQTSWMEQPPGSGRRASCVVADGWARGAGLHTSVAGAMMLRVQLLLNAVEAAEPEQSHPVNSSGGDS